MNSEVLVVGAGPAGLVSEILLGSVGVHTLVVERNVATSDEPKAVTIDDFALRTLQRAGVAEAIYPAILPGTGTKYYGRRGQLLAYARGAWPPRHGHPVKNLFHSPSSSGPSSPAPGGSRRSRSASRPRSRRSSRTRMA